MNRKTSSKCNIAQISAGQTSNQPDSAKQITTPTNLRKSTEADNNFSSPLFSQYSQEEYENFDVVWNWNSTQTKTRPRKHKRLDFAQSPELSIKRPPSNNQIADFIKLKEELETFKNEICNSNSGSHKDLHSITSRPITLEEVFNDSLENELLLCSQEVEKQASLNTNSDIKLLNNEVSVNIKPCSVALPVSNVPNLTFNPISRSDTEFTSIVTQFDDTFEELANDEFDQFLETVQDENLKYQTESFNRTTAINAYKNLQDKATTSMEDEIERKRKEALLKLQSKKKTSSIENESPIKCSPEEIEQKRLQALAKLQAKKKQEIIEHNRLEALKRLELNKKKRALQFDNLAIGYKLNM